MSRRYKRSEELLERALNTIPLGAQTFSKSITAFPHGVSPYFVDRGEGAYVWDVDGNQYVDFISALLAVTMGYNYEPVTRAVQEQVAKGVSFSMSNRLEVEVAEKLVELVPSAEKVRFGKNGSDATSAAVRLARAYTGRDHVAVCGYHGWQDWYIGSTVRNLGVPSSTQALTHRFSYNNVQSLVELFDANPDQISAVILEPMNTDFPAPGFLASVKEITHKNNALLIFDETITGCRFAKGGAQSFFGVTPDLSCFGKGLANGFPLSAVVGKAEVMDLMESIFFSGTFSGETGSLAAANVVLDKIISEPVVETMFATGQLLMKDVGELINSENVGEFFSLSGHPSWSFLNMSGGEGYSQFEIKTLFLQEVFKRGVLTLGSHNISYAHEPAHVEKLVSVYSEVLPYVVSSAREGKLAERLECDVLEPLFKVR